jgi:hypothetical protein
MNEAGFTKDQSEAVVSTMGDLVKEKFLTKQDLRVAFGEERLKSCKEFARLDKRIEVMEKVFLASIELLEKKATVKFLLLQVSVVGILAGVLIYLPQIRAIS